MKGFSILTAGALAASLGFSACSTAPTANNATVKVNSNMAVVTSTNANATVNANGTTTVTTSNANTWNANITRAEWEKDKSRWEKEAKDASSTVGQGVNDSWLWTKTRAALMTTNDLRESTINVDVVNDVVTLKGTVASAEQKKKAEEVAKGIEGVKSVTNNLQVKAADSMTNQMVNGAAANTANANKK